MSRWPRRWNWGGSQIAAECWPVLWLKMPATVKRPLRAVRVVLSAGRPLLIHRDQRTYSETVWAGKRAALGETRT
jgi:hypothetical protein